jgi:formylglycine-generating enzyme required for sulfatase activity
MYDRTYLNTGAGPMTEADPASVSTFVLDKYLVTVGRFRSFVTAWNNGIGYLPPAGSGKHTHLNGGKGLVDVTAPDAGVGVVAYETGWVASDDSNIAPTSQNLACGPYATWTAAVGTQESLPVTCVNWWEAYAFCIWDGGFLPSEAEWEYAAAAGSQQREYPWGSSPPGVANAYAIYGDGMGNCNYPSVEACTGPSNLAPVGTATLGAALSGQLDMAGEVWEWNLDWFGNYGDPCTDCASLTGQTGRVLRGGRFDSDATYLPAYYRFTLAPTVRDYADGFRCGRAP